MLRSIKQRYLQPRLFGSISLNDGAAVEASLGARLGTYTRPASGVNRLTLSQAFHRVPIIVSGPAQSDLSAGGDYVVLNADPTRTVLDPKLVDKDGTAKDGKIHSLILGNMSASTDRIMKQSEKTCFDRPRYFAFKVVGSTGVVSIGKPDILSFTKTDTGEYTVRFRKNFGFPPVVVGTLSGAHGSYRIDNLTNRGFDLGTFDETGASADRTLYLHVLGSDSVVEHATLLRSVKATHRHPERIGFHISVSGGTPSITIGPFEGTVADTGTGVFTVTLAKTFKRELLPCFLSTNRVHVSSVDENSFVLNCANAAGVAADPTDVMGFVLAYDDADQIYQGS